MENEEKLISIIVPVYNEEKTILEVLKKLLGIVVLGLLWCNTSFADNLKVIDGDT